MLSVRWGTFVKLRFEYLHDHSAFGRAKLNIRAEAMAGDTHREK